MAKKKKLSREEIHALRCKYNFDTGGKPFAEWMADLNREEKELEEAKFLRMERAGLLSLTRNSSRSKQNQLAEIAGAPASQLSRRSTGSFAPPPIITHSQL